MSQAAKCVHPGQVAAEIPAQRANDQPPIRSQRMGVLTDYFAARNDQDAARAHAAVGGPRQLGFKTAQFKSIDPLVTIAMLDEIVRGTNALEWIRANAGGDRMVAGGPDDEQWVFRVAPEHAEMLAELPGEVRPIAERWAKSEELKGFAPADLTDVLVSLRNLAREARRTGERLYCWVSL